MSDNDFPSTGRTLFTDEEYASAQEWIYPLCQSSNNGAFCMNCGSVKPAD